MEQETHQWVHPREEEEEEGMMEDDALVRKKFESHSKGGLVTERVPSFSSSSSSFSSSSNDSEHGNGIGSVVTAPDGSPVQKDEEASEIRNGGENFNHVNGDKSDYEAVGLAQVAEFAGEPTNVEAISGFNMSQNMNSVYFDKQQGMWKCHHCTWTKRFDSPWTVPNWNLKGYPDLMMSVRHMIQHAPCFVYEIKDNGVNGVLNGDAYGSVHPTNLGEREFDVQADMSVIQNSLCSENTNQSVADFHEETSAKEAPNLIKEDIDQPREEFDVEAVLEKQETHDLFCPNCNSCITKRVILKKRKRNPGNIDIKSIGRPRWLDSPEHPSANQGDSANVRSEPDIVIQEPPADDDQPHEEPEVFRCLSCFSFFIPSGKCFDAFRIFGGTSKKEGAQNPPSVPASNLQFPSNPQSSSANWFKSLINKGKKTSDAAREYSGTASAKQHNSTSITSDELTSRGIGHSEDPPADTSGVTDLKPTPNINHAHGGMDSLISSTNDLSSIQSGSKSAGDLVNGVQTVMQETPDFPSVKQLLDGNFISEGEKKGYTKEAIPKPYEGKTEFLTSATVVPQVLEGTLEDVDKKREIIRNGYSSLVQGAESPIQSPGSAIHANDVAISEQNSKTDAISPSNIDFTLIGNVPKDIDNEVYPPTRIENEGGDVIVDLGEGACIPAKADDIPAKSGIITELPTSIPTLQPRDEVGEPQGWEILKSIVYGGLVESITSLGIVSSAVSSGVTPLNIIALGFANIIGGLIILGHNLVDLKNDHSGEDQTQAVVQDRYQEYLGRRENFLLHAVVAVLSFLIFGAVPLVVYGLLINKNYYTELKLAVVAATSVVCIILLAIGKVYSSRPPKAYMKTVLYYVAMALSTSGVTYIAGNLIKDLLEKLNHPESGLAITMPISGTKTGSTWMSQ
ncbi:membrane protein of ER body-like protein isoform X2 [Vigna radiata var. radiata]|uniref:Membrane protein of ER body-like protein isoform X2 n=1 Tax=Vigna radiata var. radiata TaxID=3916 RepID=A0A1S3UGZ1_VIGRR|nr:membrane protein of ER body-like protein isoform X2 [Vigna radiata var. radiata]